MNAIELANVSFTYPGANTAALSQVNLEIPQGSFFALLGPNGAGKTTLLRLLCGRLSSFEGSLKIADEFVCDNGFLNPKTYGVLLENPGVYPKLSIEEYVNYFAGFYGFGENACQSNVAFRERVEHLSSALELPKLSTRMSALSLGNRQKVQLLRALAPNPHLLILDEPVANLDPMSREAVWRLISDWRKLEGGTAIVCSHILAEMEREATDFAIVNHGKILKSGAVNFASGSNSLEKCPSINCKKYNLTFKNEISITQIQDALNAAGIAGVSIKPACFTLSDLYKKSVSESSDYDKADFK